MKRAEVGRASGKDGGPCKVGMGLGQKDLEKPRARRLWRGGVVRVPHGCFVLPSVMTKQRGGDSQDTEQGGAS